MRTEKDLEKLKGEYKSVNIPKGAMENMEKAVNQAKKDKQKRRRAKGITAVLTAAAAVFILVILPNVSAGAAKAMGEIPIMGKWIEVVTGGKYEVKDEERYANIEIPQLQAEDEEASQAAEQVNEDVQAYIDTLIKRFEEDENVVLGMDAVYETVTDTEDWFALKITVDEMAASGYEYSRYYNIDKETGAVVELKDLFKEGSDYVSVLSELVMSQMREQMAADESVIYFIDSEYEGDSFTSIDPEQNFYMDADGNLVLSFDEYTVAPGYMGVVSFTIDRSQIEDILK